MSKTIKADRIMISSTGSGKGKTFLTLLLLKSLKDKGEDVHAFKCGPDYIDPHYHEAVLKIPSKNIDPYFMDEALMKASFADGAGGINIIEGCMGLYDGIGQSSRASCYESAKMLRVPIVLCMDAGGMGYSIVAEIKGFKAADTEDLIKGVILNRISKSYYERIAPVIENECGVKALGYLPCLKESSFDSRHLGLLSPKEADAMAKIERSMPQAANSLDINGIMEIAKGAGSITAGPEFSDLIKKEDDEGAVIAVARDEAFDFYYKDNIEALKLAGARISYFSPIRDKELPEGTRGLYIGGGYPELYKELLEENAGLRRQIKEVLDAGMPAIAECGGFMYLCDRIDGSEMTGFFDDEAQKTDGSVRFGYVEGRYKETVIKGHEFHHYDVTDPGDAFLMINAGSGVKYRAVHKKKRVLAGFPHFYFMSAPGFAVDYMKSVKEYSDENR